MITITSNLLLAESELEFTYIRASGPGGQNVNKVATAVQLRFNVIYSTSLPDNVRERLLTIIGNKLTRDGALIIKASRFRTQECNKQDAVMRLKNLISAATIIPKQRQRTKPTKASKLRRLHAKKLHAKTKLLRGKSAWD